MLWALIAAVAALLVVRPFEIAWSASVGAVLLGVAGYFAKEVVGDAARYLRPAAQNIQRRHEIRQAGIEVLEKLHERGYDRIIVVGHSLGSVVGYDVLNHAFSKLNTIARPVQAEEKALRALESLARSNTANAREVQVAQRAYFEEFVANGGRWRVTDFITLGSPLAHSEILLAENREDLQRKIEQREYPTCLPALETKIRSNDPEERYFSYVPPKGLTGGVELIMLRSSGPHAGPTSTFRASESSSET
jgi:hypothetical protein